MMLAYAWRLVWRNPRRTATYLFGLALAVGLFAAILFFVDSSARAMTATALAPVRLDLVAHATSPDVDVSGLPPAIIAQRGVAAAEPVWVADFATAAKVGGASATPSGRLFALQAGYFTTFDLLAISSGQFDPQGVLVSEAMAIAQGLSLGDQLTLTFAGVDAPVTLPVTGLVDMSNADALFATTTEAENAVVADVVFVDAQWFRAHLLTPLVQIAANPPASLPPGAILLDPQVHIKLDRARLPANPTLAAQQAAALRRAVERQFPGQLKAVDNLSGAFKVAQGDVLAARLLFIFLGLPGVALGAYLSKFAAELFAEAQRREISLLRTRGATPAQLLGLVAATSTLLAIGGTALGLVFGLLALLAGGINPFATGFEWGLFAGSAGVACLAGLALTFLAAFVPTAAALRREITQERRVVRRTEAALFWKRTYLDVLLLITAATVLVLTYLNGGFKPAGNEGSALALSFYIFLAPFFAWLGLTLLVLRLVERGLAGAAQPLAAVYRAILGEIGGGGGQDAGPPGSAGERGHDRHRPDPLVWRQPGALSADLCQRKAPRRAVCSRRRPAPDPGAQPPTVGRLCPGVATAGRDGRHRRGARHAGAGGLRKEHRLWH